MPFNFSSAKCLWLILFIGGAEVYQEGHGQISPAGQTSSVGSGRADSSPSNREALQRRAVAAGIGGPTSVGTELEEDRIRGESDSRWPSLDQTLHPVHSFKDSLLKNWRLDLGMRYSTSYQAASDSLTGTDSGWAGQVRLFGKWHIQGQDRDKGSIVFLLEDRHSYDGDNTPTGLSSQIGSLAPTAVSYGDNGPALTILYGEKVFNDGRSGIWFGKIDPTEQTSILGYANQRTTFANGAVLSNLSIGSPAPAIGIAAGTMLGDNFYTVGTISDANGSYDEIPFFEYGADFFSYVELGWMASRTFKDRYTRSFHIGFWNMDETEEVGREESYGVALGANWLIGDNILPFFRFGKAGGEGATVDTAVTVGALYKPDLYNDLFGLGLGWVKPADENLREETSVEAFYRFSISRDIAATISAQCVFNPAFNPVDDQVFVLGTRWRIAF